MKTLIIDGNNLVHRTYWTAKTQSTRTNTDTQDQINNFHIYFTLNAVFSYVTKFNPDKTIFVWDEKIDYQVNDRKLQFEDYKGNRSSDTSPHQNNNSIKQILSYLGIPSIFPRQLEADDIVSYICRFIEGKKVIISVDKDFLQLVNSNVTLYDPIRKEECTVENFEQKTGSSNTAEWLVFKSLVGDKSDNVPGVFGKAKALKFLKGDIELTPEEESTYNRNYNLFNLCRLTYEDQESEYYRDQLGIDIGRSWSSFLVECEERKFNSIIKKKETWHTLFFLKHKLASLFV
jgi:5'-3' exonuclease